MCSGCSLARSIGFVGSKERFKNFRIRHSTNMFVHFQAMVEQECVGGIVCKLDMHKKMFRRGYIAMLAVDSKHRRKSIGENQHALSFSHDDQSRFINSPFCNKKIFDLKVLPFSFSPQTSMRTIPLNRCFCCLYVAGTNLVKKAIYAMVEGDCDEVSGLVLSV